MRRLLPLVFVMLSLAPARADAITLQEIIEFTRSGLSDDVLVALIEVDARVYPVDGATLKKLRDAGVSDRVIIAMIKSGRTPAPLPPPTDLLGKATQPDPPAPQVIVVEQERPVVYEVPVAVPVYVTTGARLRGGHRIPYPYDNVSIYAPYPARPTSTVSSIGLVVGPVPPQRPVKQTEPVYWGWGGKLRPDAWKPK
jgi:hypothetical protein